MAAIMPGLLHIKNARVWTGDPARPWARSISLRKTRISGLDSDAPAEDTAHRVIDARGRVILPGLIDSHMHLLTGGRALEELDLSGVDSRETFEKAVASRHDALPAGRWLIGRSWSQHNWPGHEMPTREWLRGCGERPAVCFRMDMHAAVVNDAVLRMIDTERDPLGGRIMRADRTGDATGLLVEAALWKLVNPLIPPASPEERHSFVFAAQRHCHAMGLTAVGTMEYLRDIRDVYEPLRDRLTLRCRCMVLDRDWQAMEFPYPPADESNTGLGVIGYKAFVDGTLGSRTARMLNDYADDPGNRGLLVELAANGTLNEWAHEVARRGYSPCIHAIGDEAARLAIDAVDDVRDAMPRIEHAQQLDDAEIGRFGAAHATGRNGATHVRGLIASMQPLHKADDCRYAAARVGPERVRGTFAFRRLLDAGAVLAFGSDWPVVSCDPMLGIRAAVTGLTNDGQPFGTDQNLTVEEALTAYTRNAAYSLRLDQAGVLREGMLGDMVMLDRDPFFIDWETEWPRVVMTVANGQVVHDARPAPEQQEHRWHATSEQR